MRKFWYLIGLAVILGGGGYGGWHLMELFSSPCGADVVATVGQKKQVSRPAENLPKPRNAADLGQKSVTPPSPAVAEKTLSPLVAPAASSAEVNAVRLPAGREAVTADTVREPSAKVLAATGAAAGELPALPAVPSRPAVKKSSPNPAAAPQNLSEVYRAAENMLRQRDFAGAKALLSRHLLPGENPANANTLYRLGLVGRYAGDENAAQAAWSRAHREYPAQPAGRMSALALADTFYAWYAEKTPQYDQWEKIRALYSDAFGMDGARFLGSAVARRIGERVNRLNERLVFSRDMPVRGAQFHTVRSGENLTTIARHYNLDSWRSIAAVNHLNPANLRVGDRLKIVAGRVFILVDKREFTLSWFLDGAFIRQYRCATGAVHSETPPGRYKIVRMDVNPDWRDPNTGRTYKYGDPGHAIGSRWMALEGEGTNGLGIHGTIEPESMGKKASNGCVRLLKKDVEELYGFVSIQRGNETEVLIIE